MEHEKYVFRSSPDLEKACWAPWCFEGIPWESQEIVAENRLWMLQLRCLWDSKTHRTPYMSASWMHKFPCFVWLWDTRSSDLLSVKTEWPAWKQLTTDTHVVVHRALSPSDKILLPPLHIKFGLKIRFVEVQGRTLDALKYVCLCCLRWDSHWTTDMTGAAVPKGMFDRLFLL